MRYKKLTQLVKALAATLVLFMQTFQTEMHLAHSLHVLVVDFDDFGV